jgi:hypothetical protein
MNQFRTKTILWSAVFLISAITSLSSWAVTSPVGSAPDDDFHSVSIWCGQGVRDGICEKGPNGGALVSETLRGNYLCFASQPNNSGLCSQSQAFTETTRTNGGSYPRVFYWVTSWFAGPDIISSTIAIRIFNSFLIVSLLMLTVLLLPKHLRRIPVISVMVTAVPLGMFVIPSTNPSSWGYAGLLILFPAFLGFLSTHKTSARWILGVITFTALLMTAGSRPDSALYALISISLALLLRFSWTKTNLLFAGFGITLLLLGSFIFLTTGSTRDVVTGAPGGGLNFPSIRGTFSNLLRLPDLFVGAFGSWGLGWLDTPMPSIVWAMTFGVYCAVLFSAIRYFNSRQALAVTVTFLALRSIPMFALFTSGLSVGQFVQPRYVLPLLGLLLGVALYRTSVDLGLEFSRAQIWIAGLALAIANAVSLHTNLRRYLTGLDGTQINLNRDIEWWWFEYPKNEEIFWLSPNVLWLVGSASFALVLISIWKLRFHIGLPGSPSHEIYQKPKGKL